MKRTDLKTLFKQSAQLEGKEVSVAGWIKTLRDSKAIGFIELNDGSCFASVQIIIEDGKVNNFGELIKLNVGASINVVGTVVLTPQQKQSFELHATKVTIEGVSSPDYVLQKKRHSMEFLREIPHLRARTNTFSAVFRVRSVVSHALHRFFEEQGFMWVHTPIITGSDAEGAGEMFRVTTLDAKKPPLADDEVDYSQDFFGKETNLTVSGQLHGEAFAAAFDKIYTFGPTFRAEKSYTTRHAAEFWMLEPEIAFADLNDIKELEEAMIKYVLDDYFENCPDEIAFFNQFVDKGLVERLDLVRKSKFASITYTDAIIELEKVKDRFEFPVYWGCDIATEHERYLAEELFKGPVFVTDYPKDIKSFYMRMNEDGKTVAATDLLVPGIGELTGGSQREERLDVLEQRMKELGLSEEEYGWYLDLRRFGTNKHAGFGLGFDRFLMYITGMSNIRDVIPFPRTTGSANI